MPTQIADSLIYRDAWGTDETRAMFDDEPRTRSWLEILAVLAECQADVGLIPADAAQQVARTCRELPLDLDFFAEVRLGFEATQHSTLGLIQAVQRRCPDDTGEWLYYGATVQDLTDTWTMLVLEKLRTLAIRDLRAVEANLLDLAVNHRDTLMAGRTHGQQGLPITFGYKAAVWASETRRHIHRLQGLAERLGMVQLCGGVGSLSSLGPRGFELQQKFASRLNLRTPEMSWIAARDGIVEWFQVLTLISGTADRIGHEVYNLQRPEIGELTEGHTPGTVGSITMPHKQNPEIAEHLGTLARVIRHNAALIAECQVHDHERDGRAWKVEWAVLPETGMAAAKLLRLLEMMTGRLEVDPARARANIERRQGLLSSEAVMLALATDLGRQTAHRLVSEAARSVQEAGGTLREAVLRDDRIRGHLSAERLDALFDLEQQVGLCRELVDRVVAAARRVRALEHADADAAEPEGE